MSDDLAAQLVTAAVEAIRDVDVDRGMIGASDEEMAQAAVVAMLRTLVEEADHRGALSVSVTTLRTTADRIEQGDGGERS